MPALVHFGPSLPEHENLEAVARLSMPNVASGQSDPVVPLTLLPSAIDGWHGHPGIIMRNDEEVEIIPVWQIAGPDSSQDSTLSWTAQWSDKNAVLKLQIDIALDGDGYTVQ